MNKYRVLSTYTGYRIEVDRGKGWEYYNGTEYVFLFLAKMEIKSLVAYDRYREERWNHVPTVAWGPYP